MPNYAMVVDLLRCNGCAACMIACKSENNVPDGKFWCNRIIATEGQFPASAFVYIPTFCNHCDIAPCVEVCPVEPKAIFKDENGLTLNSADRCIGCRGCEEVCPYGVISYNGRAPHAFWLDDEAREVTEAVGGEVIPYYNPNRDLTWDGIRREGVVEKCSFCDHRLEVGELPYCVQSCPSGALFFGDLDDPDSVVSQKLEQYDHRRLQEGAGTEPRVYYIRVPDFEEDPL